MKVTVERIEENPMNSTGITEQYSYQLFLIKPPLLQNIEKLSIIGIVFENSKKG